MTSCGLYVSYMINGTLVVWCMKRQVLSEEVLVQYLQTNISFTVIYVRILRHSNRKASSPLCCTYSRFAFGFGPFHSLLKSPFLTSVRSSWAPGSLAPATEVTLVQWDYLLPCVKCVFYSKLEPVAHTHTDIEGEWHRPRRTQEDLCTFKDLSPQNTWSRFCSHINSSCSLSDDDDTLQHQPNQTSCRRIKLLVQCFDPYRIKSDNNVRNWKNCMMPDIKENIRRKKNTFKCICWHIEQNKRRKIYIFNAVEYCNWVIIYNCFWRCY